MVFFVFHFILLQSFEYRFILLQMKIYQEQC